MTYKYKNLGEVAAAFASGELDKNQSTLILDNDTSFLAYRGPLPEGIVEDSAEADSWRDQKVDETRTLFRGNGYADLADAFEAAGIPSEWC